MSYFHPKLSRFAYAALAALGFMVVTPQAVHAQSPNPCADLQANPVGAIFGAALGCPQQRAAPPQAASAADSPYAQQALDDFKAAQMRSNVDTGSWGHAMAAACPGDRPDFPRSACEQYVLAHRARLSAEVDAAKQDAAARAKSERAAERKAMLANPLPGSMKGEMPCLSGICLGDDLRSLPPMDWEEARLVANNVPLRSQRLTALEFDRAKRAVAPQTESVVRGAGPYLLAGVFDSNGIEQFKKVAAVCWHTNLVGAFKSDSGYRTLVQVTPRAIDARTQVLEVTLIKRTFTGVYSSERQEALGEDLFKRYGALVRSSEAKRLERYPMTPEEIALEKAWWNLDTRSSSPELYLVMANRLDYDPAAEAKLRALPGCELQRPAID